LSIDAADIHVPPEGPESDSGGLVDAETWVGVVTVLIDDGPYVAK
jgi:hypothetical protein